MVRLFDRLAPGKQGAKLSEHVIAGRPNTIDARATTMPIVLLFVTKRWQIVAHTVAMEPISKRIVERRASDVRSTQFEVRMTMRPAVRLDQPA